MKRRIKINFLTGDVKSENYPVAFQVFFLILVTLIFLAVVYNVKGDGPIPMMNKAVGGLVKVWIKMPCWPK